jgi:TolB-like protein/Tfp pilus assembly protein PilF
MMQVAGGKAFCFEGYTLDFGRGSLRAGNRQVELRPKSFEVLRYLLENAGRLASKEELIKAVWPDVSVTDESVTRCISDVRQALGDEDQRMIKTVLKRGYIFVAPISRPDADDGLLQPYPSTRSADVVSLVVLPFTNLGADADLTILADGITEGLTTYLSHVPDSFVVARSTSLAYKQRTIDVRQIGRELDVRYAIEGSLQLGDMRVRVSAQLIDARTGAHLWTDQFDADRTDPLDMQDNTVTRLARGIQIELATLEATRIAEARPMRTDADGFARRGEAVYLKYGPNREETESAYELCERALAVDPRNVRALSILAEKFSTRVTTGQSTDRDADIRRAAELVSGALAGDPDSHYAHQAKARVLVAQKRPDEALVEAERALALNPSYIPTYQILCMANVALARPDEVIRHADKAMQLSPPLDPHRYTFYALRASAHTMLGQDDSAIDDLRQAVANNPDFPRPIAHLAAMLALTGKTVEARDTLTRYLALPGTKSRTIAQLKALSWADNPGYLALREKLYQGLRSAGMPEE